MVIIGVICSLVANDYLTIYNNNQALYKTSLEMDLERGVQFYSLENIPTGIIRESVIFIPKDKNLSLFEQNFEYDLANATKILEKYINKSIIITTEDGVFSGLLVFHSNGNYGIQNEETNEITIVMGTKVINIQLAEMPDNFYTKPTLRWQLSTNRASKYSADLSYLTKGIEWRATYNAVLDKNEFYLNTWVTLNNQSGKDFTNVILKLIAGNVQTYQNMLAKSTGLYTRGGRVNEEVNFSAPAFEEREFSDFRLYTLDQKADIANNQEKQLSLYPLKTVKYKRKYYYNISAAEVDVIISFKNSLANGLGVPLPKGNMNFYEIDSKDGSSQFVGVNSIDHQSINQEVSLKIGTAFDVKAETKILNSVNIGRISEADYEITFTNNKSENIVLEATKIINRANGEILSPSIPYTKKDAFSFVFNVVIESGKTVKLTFKERIDNN